MTELYLVRHGQTEWSRAGRHTSVTDLDLTELGLAQAESLRDHLDPDAFQLVLASPRLRARRTAALAGFERAEILEDLAEWAYGDYEGLTSVQIHETRPDWRLWVDGCPGGWIAVRLALARPDLVARLLLVVPGGYRDQDWERAICFAHGHALAALALCWLDFPLAFGQSFPVEVARVSIMGTEKASPAIIRWNS